MTACGEVCVEEIEEKSKDWTKIMFLSTSSLRKGGRRWLDVFCSCIDVVKSSAQR